MATMQGGAPAIPGSKLVWRATCGGPNATFLGRWGWWTAYVEGNARRRSMVLTMTRNKGARAERRWTVSARTTHLHGSRLVDCAEFRNAVEAMEWAERLAA